MQRCCNTAMRCFYCGQGCRSVCLCVCVCVCFPLQCIHPSLGSLSSQCLLYSRFSTEKKQPWMRTSLQWFKEDNQTLFAVIITIVTHIHFYNCCHSALFSARKATSGVTLSFFLSLSSGDEGDMFHLCSPLRTRLRLSHAVLSPASLVIACVVLPAQVCT